MAVNITINREMDISPGRPECRDTSLRQTENYMNFYRGMSLDEIKTLGTYEEQGRALYDHIIESMVKNDREKTREAFSYVVSVSGGDGRDSEFTPEMSESFASLFYTYLKTDRKVKKDDVSLDNPDFSMMFSKDQIEKFPERRNQDVWEIITAKNMEEEYRKETPDILGEKREEFREKYTIKEEKFAEMKRKTIGRGIDFLAEGKKGNSDEVFGLYGTDFESVKSSEEYKGIFGRKKRKFIETATKHLKDYDREKAAEMLGYIDLVPEELVRKKPSRKAFIDAYMGKKGKYTESEIECLHSCMLKNGMTDEKGSKKMMIKIAHDLAGKKKEISKENGKAVLDYVMRKYSITDLLSDKDYRSIFMSKNSNSKNISVKPEIDTPSKKDKRKKGGPKPVPGLKFDINESILNEEGKEIKKGNNSNSSVKPKVTKADDIAFRKIIDDYSEPDFLKMKQETREKPIDQDWENFWSHFPDGLEDYIDEYLLAGGTSNSGENTKNSGRPQNFAKKVGDNNTRVTLDPETERTVPVDENGDIEYGKITGKKNNSRSSILGDRPAIRARERRC